jgi:hypothetical protein
VTGGFQQPLRAAQAVMQAGQGRQQVVLMMAELTGAGCPAATSIPT